MAIKNTPISRAKSAPKAKKRFIRSEHERETWKNAIMRLAGENHNLLKAEAREEQIKKNKKNSHDRIQEAYETRNPGVYLTIETEALQAFLRLKSPQIKHLCKRFDTVADLCNCIACTVDDLNDWDLFADTQAMRLAGELPRDRLALLLVNARAYGVHITYDDVIIGLGHKD